jgi:hypothetical protein
MTLPGPDDSGRERSNAFPLRDSAPWLHAAVYIATGLWPLLHLPSFEWVTGPKTDKWLVRVVGALVLVQGIVTLKAAARGHVGPELRQVAAGTAVIFAAADVRYVAQRRIRPVYLADAVLELGLAALWLIYRQSDETKDWLYSHAPRPLRDVAGWLVMESGWRLGPLAPILLGLALGRRPQELTHEELPGS